MTGAEAMTGLASLVGAGGIGAIVTGYLAYKTEAAKGRREPLTPAAITGPAGPFPGSHDFELLANAITLLVAAVNRVIVLLEEQAKERELDDEVEERELKREMRRVLREQAGRN